MRARTPWFGMVDFDCLLYHGKLRALQGPACEGDQSAQLASLEVSHPLHQRHVVEGDPELLVAPLLGHVVWQVPLHAVLQCLLQAGVQPVVVFLHQRKGVQRSGHPHTRVSLVQKVNHNCQHRPAMAQATTEAVAPLPSDVGPDSERKQYTLNGPHTGCSSTDKLAHGEAP